MSEMGPYGGAQNGASRLPGAPEEPPDDVDRLFAQLTQLPPPHDLLANVLLAVEARRASRRPLYWAMAELAALLLLGALAFLTGQTLVGGGTWDLLRAFVADFDIVRLMPGEALLALAESVPWLELAGLAGALALLVVCVRGLGQALRELARPGGATLSPGGGP
jgi:hypothetical protein